MQRVLPPPPRPSATSSALVVPPAEVEHVAVAELELAIAAAVNALAATRIDTVPLCIDERDCHGADPTQHATAGALPHWLFVCVSCTYTWEGS